MKFSSWFKKSPHSGLLREQTTLCSYSHTCVWSDVQEQNDLKKDLFQFLVQVLFQSL